MIEKGRFELEEPFKSDWKWGYIVINKEPRRNVILYNSSKNRKTISYARYLYEVSIGRYLECDSVVDHIDGNQMNDIIENFQLLSVGENNIKRYIQSKKTARMVELECGSCGKNFIRGHNTTHLVIKRNKTTYCSRTCSGKKLTMSKVLRVFRQGD